MHPVSLIETGGVFCTYFQIFSKRTGCINSFAELFRCSCPCCWPRGAAAEVDERRCHRHRRRLPILFSPFASSSLLYRAIIFHVVSSQLCSSADNRYSNRSAAAAAAAVQPGSYRLQSGLVGAWRCLVDGLTTHGNTAGKS
jgi:hypothetical protein